jgi:poly(A) polymerase
VNTKIWNKITQSFKRDKGPKIISRKKHQISRQIISPNALKVLYRLYKAGFAAHLVGGGVRDLLLEREPKDFDIATDAHPEQVRDLFRNSRIIGRRFRLVHVYYQGEIIEVSTFRGAHEAFDDNSDEPPEMIRRDNVYGSMEEDAWRRDFTVNALFYNIADFSIVDYTDGMQDLQKRLIRMIGDPVERYHEDPVRLLRAIRLAAKLQFTIESKTEKPIYKLSDLLQKVPSARLYDEMLKLFFEGNALITYQKLVQYNYMRVLFPQTMAVLDAEGDGIYQQLIIGALKATDERFAVGKSLNPGFLLSVFLWPVLQSYIEKQQNKGHKYYPSLHIAIDLALRNQSQALVIPRRLSTMMRAIWVMQFHLLRRRPKRINYILEHRYFRAGFDFLMLRVQAGENYGGIVKWWGKIQAADAKTREKMVEALRESNAKEKSRANTKKRKKH